MIRIYGVNGPYSRQRQRPFYQRWRIFCALLIAVQMLLFTSAVARAEEGKRVEVKSHETIANHWLLSSWSDDLAVCDLYVAHEKRPSAQEILDQCGKEVYLSWATTPPCLEAADGGDASLCRGLFIEYRGKDRHVVKELVKLPHARVRVEAVNCDPWGWCDDRVVMNFVGEEPLEGHRITSVHVRIGSSEKTCAQASCELRMPVTDENGVWVEYWATSDFGDESEHATFLLRNAPVEDQDNLYRLDVLGAGWDEAAPAGAVLWQVLPALEHPEAAALEQPLSVGYLATTHRYLYLAGHLIQAGVVDGSGCSGFGLLGNQTANPCGEKLAADKVLEWQNQYDLQIYTAAIQHNVPARLLKGIIAQETQFWPYPVAPYELGLGRITENGADMLLTWNIPNYLEACRSLYSVDRCSGGYPSLNPVEQAMLRGAVLSAVGTDQEMDLLAATLFASARQVKQLIENISDRPVSAVTTYEELWKLTVANYHSGSGCVGTAMQTAWDNERPMTWGDISPHLLGDCQGAIGYVESVFSLAK